MTTDTARGYPFGHAADEARDRARDEGDWAGAVTERAARGAGLTGVDLVEQLGQSAHEAERAYWEAALIADRFRAKAQHLRDACYSAQVEAREEAPGE